MYKALFTVLILSTSLSSYAEDGIKFFKGTWAEVQAEAQKQHKLIYVDVFTTWCGPCKMMEKNVFPNSAVGKLFNDHFINYQLDAEKGEGPELAKKYSVQGFPTSLFLNESGEVLHKILGALTVETFLAEANKALVIAKDDKPLAQLETEFKAGKLNAKSIQIFFNKLKGNQQDISLVLDNYLKELPETAYKNVDVLTLIAENVTSFDSKAFEILAKANKKRLGFPVEIGYAIKSGVDRLKREHLKRIIELKDKNEFNHLLSILKTQLSQIPLELERLEFEFAEKTQDKEMFQTLANKKIPRLMSLSNESLQKQSLSILNAVKIGEKMMKTDTTSEIYLTKTKDLQRVSERATADELNSFAWGYFNMVEDKTDLEEALKWSARSIELDYSANYLDTQANLLFKLGRKKEAIKKMKEAIALTQKDKESTEDFEKTLKRMKGK
ncbi:MAG: thioredoxin family protein [Arcicella sp.]|jgi:thiol-disulfide isomerase/thioredoxin|nr:thioredoxin family protein [Arcicella sp.]